MPRYFRAAKKLIKKQIINNSDAILISVILVELVYQCLIIFFHRIGALNWYLSIPYNEEITENSKSPNSSLSICTCT